MSIDKNVHSRCRPLWVRWSVRILVALLLVGVGVGAWMAYLGVSESLQAENNLHATIFVIRLVERFVSEQGRWPRSWGELEDAPFDDDLHGQGWPLASREVQRRVQIDFQVDPKEVARQDPMKFTAIQPIGPYYEYRDYGYVRSLQTTVRTSIKDAKGQ